MSIEATEKCLLPQTAVSSLKNKPRNTQSLISSIYSSDRNRDGKITESEINSSYNNICGQLNYLKSIKNRISGNLFKYYEKQLTEQKENLRLVKENYSTFGHKPNRSEHGIPVGKTVIDSSDINRLRNAAKSDRNPWNFSYTDFRTLQGPKIYYAEQETITA